VPLVGGVRADSGLSPDDPLSSGRETRARPGELAAQLGLHAADFLDGSDECLEIGIVPPADDPVLGGDDFDFDPGAGAVFPDRLDQRSGEILGNGPDLNSQDPMIRGDVEDAALPDLDEGETDLRLPALFALEGQPALEEGAQVVAGLENQGAQVPGRLGHAGVSPLAAGDDVQADQSAILDADLSQQLVPALSRPLSRDQELRGV